MQYHLNLVLASHLRQNSCAHQQVASRFSPYLMRSTNSSFHSRKLPPYIIHRGKKLWSTWVPKNGFPGTRYNVTKSGWVEEEVFYDWFTNQFCPTVQHITRPLILFFDGHRAHISARIVKTAMDNGIELECLPPHTTTLLQPLDVVTLHKVKSAWRILLTEHNTKTNSASIGKAKFSSMVSLLVVENYAFFKARNV